MILHVGVTGSRHGMSGAQRHWLRNQFLFLDTVTRGEIMLHHGDCKGVDQEAHDMVHDWQGRWRRVWRTHSHPPDAAVYRAFTERNVLVELPKPYLVRDQELVAAVSLLLAVPDGPIRVRGSGTWATVRYAEKTPDLEVRIAPWHIRNAL